MAFVALIVGARGNLSNGQTLEEAGGKVLCALSVGVVGCAFLPPSAERPDFLKKSAKKTGCWEKGRFFVWDSPPPPWNGFLEKTGFWKSQLFPWDAFVRRRMRKVCSGRDHRLRSEAVDRFPPQPQDSGGPKPLRAARAGAPSFSHYIITFSVSVQLFWPRGAPCFSAWYWQKITTRIRWVCLKTAFWGDNS